MQNPGKNCMYLSIARNELLLFNHDFRTRGWELSSSYTPVYSCHPTVIYYECARGSYARLDLYSNGTTEPVHHFLSLQSSYMIFLIKLIVQSPQLNSCLALMQWFDDDLFKVKGYHLSSLTGCLNRKRSWKRNQDSRTYIFIFRGEYGYWRPERCGLGRRRVEIASFSFT